jgi:branched-chain amino acid transport system substrate-binding protein
MTSDMAVAVTPIANEARVVLMSPTATTEALSGKDDYFLRVASTSSTYAQRSASYLIKSGKIHRAVAVYDLGNASFSRYWVDNFRKFFTEQGGEVITAIGFRAEGDRTFMQITREVLAADPDGVVIVANSMDSALFCQQIRKIDPQINIFLSDWGWRWCTALSRIAAGS